MGLNAPSQGLRSLVHNSKQAVKVSLVIPAGDELAVSDDVAAQLHAASTHFESLDAEAPASTVVFNISDEAVAGVAKRSPKKPKA